jgi:hypothetical protein
MVNGTFRVGDVVVFGRPGGEQTIGRVLSVVAKSLAVEQLEERGRARKRGVGTRWRIAPSFARAATDAERASVEGVATARKPPSAKAVAYGFAPLPEPSAPWGFARPGAGASAEPQRNSSFAAAPEPPRSEPRARRSQAEIVLAIVGCYDGLSPENLCCDGEASATYVRRRGAQLRAELRRLFDELGFELAEEQAYRLADVARRVAVKCAGESVLDEVGARR